MSHLPRIARAWGQAWLTADPRALGLFRIAFGLLCIWDVLRRWPWIETFYANTGVLTNHFALFRPQASYTLSLLHAFSRPEEVAVFFAITLIALIFFTLGYYTKTAHVIALIGVISIHSRNIMLENGGDVVMNLWWVWTLFLPLGRRFSIDALRASWHHHEAPEALNHRPPPDRTLIWSLAVFAVLWQLAVIYFFNTVHKSGHTWSDGTAIAWTLEQDRIVTPLGVWIREAWPQWILKAMTWGTLVIEGAAPLLLLSPIAPTHTRRIAFITLTGLHAGIYLTTDVGLFSPTMVVAYLILLTPRDIDLLKRALTRLAGPPILLAYDSDCGVCHACARLLARLDRLDRITLIARDPAGPLPPGYDRERFDTEREDTIIVWTEGTDRIWLRHRALARALAALPLGRLIAWTLTIPGITWLLERAYRAFAPRRHHVSAFLGYGLCGLPQSGHAEATDAPADAIDPAPAHQFAHRLRSLTAHLAIIAIFAACTTQLLIENRFITRTLGIRHAQPEWARAIVQYGRLFQGWSMFAPNAPTGDGWMVIDAQLADGTHIDPQTGHPPIIEPISPGRMPPGQFWGSYSMRLAADRNRRFRDGLTHWLRNRDITRLTLPPGVEVVAFTAWWIPDRSPTPGSGAAPRLEPQQEVMRWPAGR